MKVDDCPGSIASFRRAGIELVRQIHRHEKRHSTASNAEQEAEFPCRTSTQQLLPDRLPFKHLRRPFLSLNRMATQRLSLNSMDSCACRMPEHILIYFIVERMLLGTFAATLYRESTNSVMSYFRVEAKRIATSLSESL